MTIPSNYTNDSNCTGIVAPHWYALGKFEYCALPCRIRNPKPSRLQLYSLKKLVEDTTVKIFFGDIKSLRDYNNNDHHVVALKMFHDKLLFYYFTSGKYLLQKLHRVRPRSSLFCFNAYIAPAMGKFNQATRSGALHKVHGITVTHKAFVIALEWTLRFSLARPRYGQGDSLRYFNVSS